MQRMDVSSIVAIYGDTLPPPFRDFFVLNVEITIFIMFENNVIY